MNKTERPETAPQGNAGIVSYRKVAGVLCDARCRYEEKRGYI
jgi:hypothetical protein